MIVVAVGPPRHVAGITCWCRPRLISDPDEGQLWLHRHVTLLPDYRPRAFQSVHLSPPV